MRDKPQGLKIVNIFKQKSIQCQYIGIDHFANRRQKVYRAYIYLVLIRVSPFYSRKRFTVLSNQSILSLIQCYSKIFIKPRFLWTLLVQHKALIWLWRQMYKVILLIITFRMCMMAWVMSVPSGYSRERKVTLCKWLISPKPTDVGFYMCSISQKKNVRDLIHHVYPTFHLYSTRLILPKWSQCFDVYMRKIIVLRLFWNKIFLAIGNFVTINRRFWLDQSKVIKTSPILSLL